MSIPKSTWTLKKEYFTVKLVDDFKAKYLEYSKELGNEEDSKLLNFIEFIMILKKVELYQFPGQKIWDNDDNEQDYFEKTDDNYVLPRHLFELI